MTISASTEQFSQSLTGYQQRLGADATAWYRVFLVGLFNEMSTGGKYSPGTPVDTGFARANWDAGVGSPPPFRQAPASLAATVAQRAAKDLTQAKLGDRVYFANNAHYIRFLEYGTSRMAPRGFIRAALWNMEGLARDAARLVLARRGAP